MKLKECLELGKICGLTTWEQCYNNVDLHAMSIFKYDEINKEILELQKDMFAINPDKFCEIFNVTKEDLINKGWNINKQQHTQEKQQIRKKEKAVYAYKMAQNVNTFQIALNVPKNTNNLQNGWKS